MNKLTNTVLVLGLFLIATLILTYPLLTDMGMSTLGDYDIYLFLWNLWWVKHAIFELNINPLFSDYIFHPTGVTLSMATVSFYNAIVGIPLQILFGLEQTYNLLILSTFVLAGFGTYLLAEKITGSRPASFVAGLIYAFSPYHYLQVMLGHLNLASLQWIPFYILYLLKVKDSRKISSILIASFFLILVALSSWQLLGFMLLFTSVFLIHFWLKDKDPGLIWRTFTILLISFTVIAPILYSTIVGIFSGMFKTPGMLSSAYYSMDMLSFFLPTVFHPLFGSLAKTAIGSIITPIFHPPVLPLGYAVLILAFYNPATTEALNKLTGKLNSHYRRIFGKTKKFWVLLALLLIWYAIFQDDFVFAIISVLVLFLLYITFLLLPDSKINIWIKTTLIFFILSFGPLLHVFGKIVIPMPFLALLMIPGFTIFRVPARFDVVIVLSLSILAAGGLKRVLENSQKKGLVFVIIVAALIFEFLAVPLPITTLQINPFYDNISKDAGDFAILEVPIPPRVFTLENVTFISGIPQYQYYQTKHEKRILGGYVAYPNNEAIEFINKTSILRMLNDPDHNNLSKSEIARVIPTLKKLDVKYVIIHHDILNTDLFENGTNEEVNLLLEQIFGKDNIHYQDKQITVYKVF